MLIRKYEEIVETDISAKAAFIEGDFNVGAKGFLEFHSGQKIDIKLICVDINKAFTMRMKLPLATMDFFHIYTKASENSKASITHGMEFKGLAAPIWFLIIGRDLKKSLRSVMLELIKQAEV